MLTLKYITDNTDEVIARLAKKHFDGKESIGKVVELDSRRKKTQAQLDAFLSEINQLSRQVGDLYKQGKTEEANALKTKTAELKEASKDFSASMDTIETEITDILLTVPNIPNPNVPEGVGAADNLVERIGGVIPRIA